MAGEGGAVESPGQGTPIPWTSADLAGGRGMVTWSGYPLSSIHPSSPLFPWTGPDPAEGRGAERGRDRVTWSGYPLIGPRNR